MHLRELVCADDVCLMATSPIPLQALLDALATYSPAVHIEASVSKTSVIVSHIFLSSSRFTCNGQFKEQVSSFRYLGLHFHQSGNVSHLVHASTKSNARLAVLGLLHEGAMRSCNEERQSQSVSESSHNVWIHCSNFICIKAHIKCCQPFHSSFFSGCVTLCRWLEDQATVLTMFDSHKRMCQPPCGPLVLTLLQVFMPHMHEHLCPLKLAHLGLKQL